MDDYISRQTVLRCIKESRDGIDWGQSEDGDAFLHYSAALYRTIDSEECVHAADVVPVVHGKWIPQKENYEFKETWMKCSACGYPVSRWTGNTNFCPNCGARMVE